MIQILLFGILLIGIYLGFVVWDFVVYSDMQYSLLPILFLIDFLVSLLLCVIPSLALHNNLNF